MVFVDAQLKIVKDMIRARLVEVRVAIMKLEAQLRPVVEEVIAVLKQMSVSARYTADKLQMYMTPAMKVRIEYFGQ